MKTGKKGVARGGAPRGRFVAQILRAVVGLICGGGAAQAQWQSVDIGTTTTGATSESGGVISISGSGRDIWNEADGFRYYYREVTGEFDVIVRVRSQQNTWGWAKAGIMARESLAPGSPHRMICVTPEHGTAFQWRGSANSASQTNPPTEDGGAPRWLRLTRNEGNGAWNAPYTLKSYTSFDGINWTLASWVYGHADGDNAPPVLLGLAVTSHVDGVLCTAQFDQITAAIAPAAPTNLRVTHRGPNGRIDLAWTDNSPDETGFIVEAKHVARHDQEPYVKVAEVGPNVTTFSVTGLYDASYYQFRIKAVKGTVGAYSAVTERTRTMAPIEIAVSSLTSDSITVRIKATTSSMVPPRAHMRSSGRRIT
jgi:hypothetical protein